MSAGPEGTHPNDVLAALISVPALRVGTFRYDEVTDRWWWSNELYRILGFEPGQVSPTTATIASHLHPDDREDARWPAAGAGPAATVRRILDRHGEERAVAVVVVGPARSPGHAAYVGYVADVTNAVQALAVQHASGPDSAHAVIAQAVGIVTATTGRPPHAALALLRSVSARRKVTARELADRIIAAATAVDQSVQRTLASTADTVNALLAMREDGHPGLPSPREPPPDENDATQF